MSLHGVIDREGDAPAQARTGLIANAIRRFGPAIPDQLVTVLQTRKADERGLFAAGLRGGDRRVEALHDAIMTAYRELFATT